MTASHLLAINLSSWVASREVLALILRDLDPLFKARIVSRPESIENRWDMLYRDYPEGYEEFSNVPYHPSIYEQLTEIIDIHDKCIADIGAGTGTSSLSLSRSAHQVIGIEREPAMLQQAQQKARAKKLANVTFLGIDALSLP